MTGGPAAARGFLPRTSSACGGRRPGGRRDAKLTVAEGAAPKVTVTVAQIGEGTGFVGTSLGVVNLEDVLDEVKRRI